MNNDQIHSDKIIDHNLLSLKQNIPDVSSSLKAIILTDAEKYINQINQKDKPLLFSVIYNTLKNKIELPLTLSMSTLSLLGVLIGIQYPAEIYTPIDNIFLEITQSDIIPDPFDEFIFLDYED